VAIATGIANALPALIHRFAATTSSFGRHIPARTSQSLPHRSVCNEPLHRATGGLQTIVQIMQTSGNLSEFQGVSIAHPPAGLRYRPPVWCGIRMRDGAWHFHNLSGMPPANLAMRANTSPVRRIAPLIRSRIPTHGQRVGQPKCS